MRVGALSVLPVTVLAALLLTATWFDGAFALRHWGPVAVLCLIIAAASAWSGAAGVGKGGPRVALAAIFGLAAWALLSALWADSAASALEGGARTLLYAALFMVALTTPGSADWAARLGILLMAAVGAIAAITLGGLLGDGTSQFLAGRLDDPVGYRNATACLFAMGFWPFVCTMAHRDGNPLLRALAFAGAVLVLGLAFLTQSRGVAIGLLLGGIVALALGPDRLRRASVALVAFGALALASDRLLTPYRAFAEGRPEAPADIAPAVEALVLLVLAGFAAALGAALLDGGLRVSGLARIRLRRAAVAGIAALLPLAVAAALVVMGNPVTFAGDRVSEFRGLETAAPGETRLGFAGGQRADLWRVALREVSRRPLTGAGEGNYAFGYYRERRTDRNLSTPHSRVFELLAQNGLVGAAAFLALLAGVALAVARGWRAAPPTTRRVASGLLAAAAVVLGQAAVDWIWLVPGVMGLAFVSLGLALAALRPAGEDGAGRAAARPLRAVVATVLALTAAGVGALYLADAEVRRARAPESSPHERLSAARHAGRLNPWSVTPLYLQAGALEELGRPPAAERELRDALELEPANFATLGLLGDLALREGDPRAARSWYRRAVRLNPLDAGLRKLSHRAG